MPTGTVKFFSDSEGSGFIQQDGGGNDAFVHVSAVEGAGMRSLRESQRLSYDLEQDSRGRCSAVNLHSVQSEQAPQLRDGADQSDAPARPDEQAERALNGVSDKEPDTLRANPGSGAAITHSILEAFRLNPRTRHPAVLVRDDGSEDAATITEYTEHGFRLAVTLRPNLGERVLIRTDGNRDLPARIRWAHGVEAGGSF